MHRRWKIAVAALALAAGNAFAQDYPSKPIILVVPFAPGGSSELLSRLVGQKITENWKQQVVVPRCSRSCPTTRSRDSFRCR